MKIFQLFKGGYKCNLFCENQYNLIRETREFDLFQRRYLDGCINYRRTCMQVYMKIYKCGPTVPGRDIKTDTLLLGVRLVRTYIFCPV